MIVVSRSSFAGRRSDRIVQAYRDESTEVTKETDLTQRNGATEAKPRRIFRYRALLHPCEIFRQRTPQVDVPGEGLDLFPVDEHLHRIHRRQVRGQRVDDGVD